MNKQKQKDEDKVEDEREEKMRNNIVEFDSDGLHVNTGSDCLDLSRDVVIINGKKYYCERIPPSEDRGPVIGMPQIEGAFSNRFVSSSLVNAATDGSVNSIGGADTGHRDLDRFD